MKILILASNPRKDLNLNEEIRDLQSVIERSRQRAQFEIKVGLAVRPEDLQGLLLKHEPQIVHFCGHGTGEQGLVLQDKFNKEQVVSTDALKNFFQLFAEQVECVLLNACYSETQADAIVEHINYVIGMSQTILDTAAIAFATGFYGALGYGRSIEESYKFGCNQIHLTSSSGSGARRSTVSEEQRKLEVVDIVGQTAEQAVNRINLPEYLKPQLKKKSSLTRVTNSAGTDSSQQLSTSEEVDIQLTIDRSYEEESRLKEYRDQVREYLQDHQLANYEKDMLSALREELGLSTEEADKILEEEYAPIRQAQQAYERRLMTLIKYYPFNEAIQAELKKFQDQRNLTDAEVNQISRPIFQQAEAEYQERLEKQHKLRLKVFEFNVPIVRENCTVTYRQGQAEYFSEELSNDVILDMVSVPGGTFIMGSSDVELERSNTEGPQHQVTIQAFFMGKFAVTQAQWKAVAGLPKMNQDLDSDPSYFKGNNCPVENVSWHDAIEFCDRLSHKTGKQYRLPSEAEWEYACRAGTATPFYCGETITTDLANYRGTDWEYKGRTYPGFYGDGSCGSYREQTTEVGRFPSNGFGLHDMHGNVWEWCADHWHENYQGAPIDGSVWMANRNNKRMVIRGGSWYSPPMHCRSAYRSFHSQNEHINRQGFRVVCGLA